MEDVFRPTRSMACARSPLLSPGDVSTIVAKPLKEASHGMGLPRFDAETSYAEITDDGLRNPAGLEEDHDTANNIIRR